MENNMVKVYIPLYVKNADIVSNVANLISDVNENNMGKKSDNYQYYYDKEVSATLNMKNYLLVNNGRVSRDELIGYLTYVLKQSLVSFYEFYNMVDSDITIQELDEMFPESFYEDIEFVYSELVKMVNIQKEVKDNKLSFLNNNGQKNVFFTGNSLEDISYLMHSNKNLISSLEKKLTSMLSGDSVPGMALVECLKSKGLVAYRVHFADDYRIVFCIDKDVVTVLGINLKNGKDLDYAQYISIASAKEELYSEIEDFKKGILEGEHDHYKVLEIFENMKEKKLVKSK